jgi:hypothetical protein
MELFTFEYLLLAVFLTAFKAIPDGLMMRRNGMPANLLKRERYRYWADSLYFIYHAVISLMLILALTDYCRFSSWILQYPSNLYKVIAGFIMFRFGLFDPILNISAGIEINYIGTTKRWDKIIRWICDKTKCPVEYILFIRLCIAGMGIGWLITANRP